MSECTCHKNYTLDTLIPQVGVITDIRQETPDVKTFRVNAPEGGKLFEHMPGQCAMVCAPGISEGMFSITSSPTNKEFQEFSIKKCGILTDYLHSLEVGDEITVRGPYGNHFPVETELKGKNLLFIAGGIGLAPLRSVINYVLDNRENYGTVDILYGSRSADDLVQLKEIQEVWMKTEGVNVYLTIDREQEGWDGHVGFVPNYLKEVGFTTDKTALVCGPPIMIKFVLAALQEMGFSKEQVYTTLELRMKCGVGKCGRCNIGSKYVCKDGPVFRCDEIDERVLISNEQCAGAYKLAALCLHISGRIGCSGIGRRPSTEMKGLVPKMEKMVNVYFFGKRYSVPADLTIMTAMEYAGYTLKRGCGCRHGFCGACATIYRIKGINELKTCLACQTQVEEGMYVASIPYFPTDKRTYEIEEIKPTQQIMMELYPEIYSCIGCNACTKACTQDLNVMQYIAYAQRGEFEKCAEESFDCISCGCCSVRCPAGISHPMVGLLARRLTGKYIAPETQHLKKRVEEIQEGAYDELIEQVMQKPITEMQELYNTREIEK